MRARRVVPVGVTRAVVPVTVEDAIIRPVVSVAAKKEKKKQPGEETQFMPYKNELKKFICQRGRIPLGEPP